MIHGFIRHEDSIGNGGTVGRGDVQWMTAGSSIIHSEMPGQTDGLLHGFQLWVNLPSSQKMMNPKYQEIQAKAIPEEKTGRGVSIKVISGRYGDIQSPVRDIVVDPSYIDVALPQDAEFFYEAPSDYTCFAYIYDGDATFGSRRGKAIGPEHVVLLGKGEKVAVFSPDAECCFILASGRPVREPVAWRGPIVMNTEQELQQAFEEYRNGTFIKR
jgi:redox-sensitive bicupin YhaK (pirin superfamily)